MSNLINLTGMKFSRLRILEIAERATKTKGIIWKCLCDCGSTVEVKGQKLRTGHTKSCGCARKSKYKAGQVGLNCLFLQYQGAAKRKNRDFMLTLEEFEILTSSQCFYCGNSPSSSVKSTSKMTLSGSMHTEYIYNGIDRVDSQKGYLTENCVPCCKVCNQMKMDFSQEFFFSQINKIMAYRRLT
jgi:hypothetical protein